MTYNDGHVWDEITTRSRFSIGASFATCGDVHSEVFRHSQVFSPPLTTCPDTGIFLSLTGMFGIRFSCSFFSSIFHP